MGEIIQGEMTEEKQAQDRAPWNSESKEKRRGRQPIKEGEKHVVSVERIWFGNRQLWLYVPGEVTLPLSALVFSSLCACVLSHFSRVRLFVDSMGCSSPGFSVRAILQARILEWVSKPSSRASS